jgi:hypothetical protein
MYLFGATTLAPDQKAGDITDYLVRNLTFLRSHYLG